jgi:tetratricopeptide (TPR) repeat protein
VPVPFTQLTDCYGFMRQSPNDSIEFAIGISEDDRSCLCGSGLRARECCGENGASLARSTAAANRSAGLGDRALGALTPVAAELRRRLDTEASIRRELDLRASVRNQPVASAQGAAERRRTAAKLMKIAARLRQSGQMAQSIQPLQQAIAADPENSNAHYDLGLTLMRCVRLGEAIGPLQRAIALKPNFTEAYFSLGEALDTLGREAAAAAALRRATECSPNFTEAHRRLGHVLHRLERFREARECFRRGAAAGRNTTLGRVCEAYVLAEDGKFVDAVELMRRAWAREPSDHLACATLAYLLANLGDLEAATAQFERAATLSPTPINSWAALVQLKKLTAADRPLIDKIEAYLRRNGLTDVGRMTLHFALGKANDDLGEYERAMHHFDAANRIRSMLCPFNRDACTREIDGLIAKFSKHFFAEHGGEGLDDETPLLVTGMPRSGTTLVEQMLRHQRAKLMPYIRYQSLRCSVFASQGAWCKFLRHIRRKVSGIAGGPRKVRREPEWRKGADSKLLNLHGFCIG